MAVSPTSEEQSHEGPKGPEQREEDGKEDEKGDETKDEIVYTIFWKTSRTVKPTRRKKLWKLTKEEQNPEIGIRPKLNYILNKDNS